MLLCGNGTPDFLVAGGSGFGWTTLRPVRVPECGHKKTAQGSGRLVQLRGPISGRFKLC